MMYLKEIKNKNDDESNIFEIMQIFHKFRIFIKKIGKFAVSYTW